MARSRRVLRAYALVCASLALTGGSSAVFAVPLLPLAVITQPAQDKKDVAIKILVIEADKKGKDFAPELAFLKENMPGYSGAKLLDELNTKAEEGSSVSLEILKKSGEARLLKVTVRSVEPNRIRLRVEVDAFKLSADTTHENGGWFVIRHKISEDKAMFLAVKPTP